ncbi:MAG: hypothetical protein AVDCRST_MAG49-3432 [uncultured Thermomicrobiales bacterium]|uniref:Uncharacterized protein n=1 Tax=uncultured Thermomicrobiales bacterium TaxID=1645740 RepID=A0A6J4V5P8_9BACT|nr:MAG: hypothetical protein AVDCRST_MAG49-3432 [uncultured Thermomicrobiales bacterium]
MNRRLPGVAATGRTPTAALWARRVIGARDWSAGQAPPHATRHTILVASEPRPGVTLARGRGASSLTAAFR